MTKLKNVIARFLVAMLLMALGLSVVAVADPPQGRGIGKVKKAEKFDRDYGNYDDCRVCRDDRGRRGRGLDKKDEKFINGHDARDGRWDGRGPKPRVRRLPPPRRYFR